MTAYRTDMKNTDSKIPIPIQLESLVHNELLITHKWSIKCQNLQKNYGAKLKQLSRMGRPSQQFLKKLKQVSFMNWHVRNMANVKINWLLYFMPMADNKNQEVVSRRCMHSHIRELRCIRPYLDFKTANTIATSIVHFKLDYCNSLYYNLFILS